MEEKIITQKISILPENEKEEEIPLPDQKEKEVFYSPNIFEEQKNSEIESDIELKNYINNNQKNINDYKLKNVCELVYSEEIFPEKERYISYDKLIDLLNIKEPYDRNKSKNFIHKNYNTNNEIFFSSNFESGNLRYAIKHDLNEYDLILRPETGSIRNYQWFYFRVKININSDNLDKINQNPVIKFNIINLCKNKIILNNKTRILCYYNGQWSRDTKNVYYFPSDIPYLTDNNNNINNNILTTNIKINNDIINSNVNLTTNANDFLNNNITNNNNNNNQTNGKSLNYHTLTFSFDLSKITTNPQYVYFSYCYPYTYSQLNNFLSTFNNYKNILRQCEIGETLDGAKIQLLIITNFNDSLENIGNKKAIIFTGRVHPGESNSSYVMQGLIEYLLSNEPKAENLRNHFIFKIIPMLNPDGVIRGNFRMNSVGKDLNRMWTEENVDNSPSVYFCHKLIQKTLLSRKIYFFCDFHGHSNKHNFFLYSCKSKNDFIKIGNNNIIPNPNKKKLTFYELIFQEIYSKENNFFDKFSCVNKILPSKIKTARAVLKNRYKIDFSYCLETSLGSMKTSDGAIIPFSIEQYKKVGRDFGISLNKFCVPKIYYFSYNIVRANENKLNFGNKKNRGKDLFLPMINANNGIPNNNYNKVNLPSFSKVNNEPSSKNGNSFNKKNVFKNKIGDKNKIIFGFLSPGKERNFHHYKFK
jgi:hypothetical protein